MEDILSTITRQFLPQMEPEDRRRAITSLQAILDSELLGLAQEGMDPNEIETCPYCGSPYRTKRGFDQYGNQRYLCKGCARTFTARSRKIFSTTKLPRETWMRFIQCHVDVLPLRESAERCGVCLKTAFFMRHRLLEAIRKTLPSFQVESGCGAELDECFLRESFKGNHSRSEMGIPRHAHRRACSTDGYEKICVLTGINDAGDVFYEVAGRGGLDKGAAIGLLAEKITSGAIISTDKAHVYKQVLPALGIEKHNAYARDEHSINRINNLHGHIKSFISDFHGVATRRLGNYLAWFKWIWSFKVCKSSVQLANLIVKQAAKFTYETTWSEYKVTPYPFFDYWIKQARWDAHARKAIYGAA